MFFDTLYMPAPIGLYYKMVWCSSIFMLYIVLCHYFYFSTKFHYELLWNIFLQFVTTICCYFLWFPWTVLRNEIAWRAADRADASGSPLCSRKIPPYHAHMLISLPIIKAYNAVFGLFLRPRLSACLRCYCWLLFACLGFYRVLGCNVPLYARVARLGE